MRPERIARYASYAADFVAPDQVRPAIVRHLHRMLGVEEAPEPEQRAAVDEWLRTHEPMPGLRRQLEEEYGYEFAAASPPPRD